MDAALAFCRSRSRTENNGGVTNLPWTGRSPEDDIVIETVVNGGTTVSGFMNPNGIPAIAQGGRAGEVTLDDTSPADANRNAVAAIDGIYPRPGIWR
jgi:hypothetical protein